MILFATSFHFSKFKLGSGFIFEPSRFTQLILCQIFLSSSALDMHLFRLDFKAKVKCVSKKRFRFYELKEMT